MPNQSCSYCQSLIKVGALFCGGCGQSTTAESKKLSAKVVNADSDVDINSSKNSWKDLKETLLLFGYLLTTSLIIGIIYQFKEEAFLLIALQVIDVFIILSFMFTSWQKVSLAFIPRNSNIKSIFKFIIFGLCTYIFLQLYFYVLAQLGWPVQSATENYFAKSWPVWSMFIAGAIIPGVFEEIAFRGIIQTRLSQILTPRESLIIQAALFSIIHLSIIIFVSHFVMGLFLGWIRKKSGHIYYGILVHVAWNSYVIYCELK